MFTERLADEREDEEAGRDVVLPASPRHTRRLSDKILVAFHQACDTAILPSSGNSVELARFAALLVPALHLNFISATFSSPSIRQKQRNSNRALNRAGQQHELAG